MKRVWYALDRSFAGFARGLRPLVRCVEQNETLAWTMLVLTIIVLVWSS